MYTGDQSAQIRLERLLRDLFSAEELRRFLTDFGGKVVVDELPYVGSLADLAYQAVGILERRNLIDHALFTRLQEERPRRKHQVDAVSARWFATLENASAAPKQGTPSPQRSEEQRWLSAARIFATSIREEQQHARLDLKDALRRAAEYQRNADHEYRQLTAPALDLLRVAAAFHERFYNLSPEVYNVLDRMLTLRTAPLRDGGIGYLLQSPLTTGWGTNYTFENVERVLRAVQDVCSARGQQFSDDLRPSRRQARPPRDSDILCVRRVDPEIHLDAGSMTGTFRQVTTYGARAAPLWRPQLRRTDDDFRIYAQDARTVYRWDPGEARPEAEWSVPSESLDVEFSRLVVICEGPVEFVVDVGGALWAKPLAEVGLVPLPMSSYDWTIASDPAGAPDRLIAVEWMQGNDPPEALVLREVGLVDLHNVRKRELQLGQSLIGHRDLLTWEGEPLSLGRAYWVVPGRYQGYECLLIVCMLKPHGAAIFFVDAATGRSLRTPAIAPCDVRDPTIVASNGKEYLVCQVPWREEGAVLVFDVTDHLRAQVVAPCGEFGGRVRSLRPMAPGRLLAAFAGSQRTETCVGIVDLTGRQPRFEQGPTLEHAADDVLWMSRG